MPSVAVYDVSDPHHNEGNAFGLDARRTQDTFNPAQAYVLKSSATPHSTSALGRN